MQIILASAKIMNSKTAVSVPEKTVPVFSSKAERFALEMSSWDVETLAKRLNCSNSIALENQLRFQSFFLMTTRNCLLCWLITVMLINIFRHLRSPNQTFGLLNTIFSSRHSSMDCFVL